MTRTPNRRLRILVGAQLVWLGLVSALVLWWSRNILSQARKIAELELRFLPAGAVDAASSTVRLHRTEWMIQGETASFLLAIVALTFGVIWFYWRDSIRNRGIQAFFASMTHELRTPLTSIRLQAESIADSLPQGGAEGPLVQRLLEDTTRLEAQVERTLELARVEGGGPLALESLALRPAIARVLRSLSEGWGTRVELELSDWPERWRVEADLGALHVILRNVVENAVRHSGRALPVLRITASGARAGAHLRLDLVNETESRDEKSYPRQLGGLFEKGPHSQGAGVGLYLIRTLMERMGGRAEFHPTAVGGRGFTTALFFKMAGGFDD